MRGLYTGIWGNIGVILGSNWRLDFQNFPMPVGLARADDAKHKARQASPDIAEGLGLNGVAI